MKKKTLLCTTIAGAMFITGLTMTNVKAATDEVAKAKLGVNFPDEGMSSVVVELMNGKTSLMKEDVIRLVESKYVNKDGTLKNVKVVDVTANEDGTVGTGAVVTLNSGKKLTVVLYGDVNGDGKIAMADAYRLLRSSFGLVELSKSELAAGNVVHAGGYGDLADSYRIFNYDYNHETYDEADEYADWFVEFKEQVPETMNVTATGEATKSYVLDAPVVVDENGVTNVEVKVVLATAGETRQGYAANRKWVKVYLDPQVNSWEINEDADYGTDKDAKGNVTATYVWVEVKENSQVTVQLTNKNDETEKMNVVLKIVDVTMPTISAISTTEGDKTATLTANNVVSNPKTATVSMNANVMTATENPEGTLGKWYKLQLTTDRPASELRAVTAKKNEAGEYEEVATYYLQEGAASAENGKYNVVVWLDASNPKTSFVLANAKATETQILNEITNKHTIDVTLANGGDLKISKLYTGINEGSSATDNHLVLVGNPTKTDDYTITVKGKLNEMTPYVFGTKTVDGETVTDYTKTIVTDEDGNPVENGKKYYVVLVDTGYSNEKIHGEGVITDKSIIANFTTTAETKLGNYIMLVLDAEQKETEFKLTNAYNPDNDEVQENFNFKVEFVDVGKPTVVSARELEDVKPVTTVGYTAQLPSGARAQTITVGVVKSAMENTKHKVGEEETEGLWYQLVVDTGVNNTELTVDGKDAEKGTGATEIVLWVNANDTSKQFTIANKNDSVTGNALTLTITNNEAGQRHLTAQTTGITAFADDTTMNSNKENVLLALGTGAKEEDIANILTNAKAFTVSKANGSTIDCTYELNVNLNKLEKFALQGKTAKWLPLLINIADNTNLANKWYDDSAYLETVNVKYFITTNVTQTALLWVNAEALPNLEKGATVDTAMPFTFEINNDQFNVVEKLTARLVIAQDTSTFKNTDSTATVTDGYTLTTENIKDNPAQNHFTTWESQDQKTNALQYYLNQALISSVKSERDGNKVTVTVTGDFVRMNQLTNNAGGIGKLVTLKLDLGVDIDNGDTYQVDYTTDQEGKTWKDSWTNLYRDDKEDYGCTETQDYWNEVVKIDPTKTSGTIFTRGVRYRKGSDGTGDYLTFVINYVQEDMSSTDYDALVKDVNDMVTAAGPQA